MDIHNSNTDIHNWVMNIHNSIMDIHHLIMYIHNSIMDIHNYRVYAFWLSISLQMYRTTPTTTILQFCITVVVSRVSGTIYRRRRYDVRVSSKQTAFQKNMDNKNWMSPFANGMYCGFHSLLNRLFWIPGYHKFING